MEYADALAEAGSGKTCVVDVQAADVCHLVSACFVWGGQKKCNGDFMEGAVVVVLNADGKAFLAHNMVLCDDDQWTFELVRFPAQGPPMTRLPSFLTCVRRCGGLSIHPWARSPG